MKLIGPEAESTALQTYLIDWPDSASSALLRVEVLRAVSKWGPEAIESARERLLDLMLVAVDATVLDAASTIAPQVLRSLDAIHLATAQQLGTDLGVLVTYDRRLAQAATELGLPVAAPA